MKFKINGQEFEIKDSDSFLIELEGNFQQINTVTAAKKGATVSQYSVGANSISVGGDFIVGGRVLNNPITRQLIKIVINGDAGSVNTLSGDVKVKGSSKNINTQNGDVNIYKDVSGDVSTMNGDITVKGAVKGNIRTMSGDIKTK